jgi:hypothetical protein
LKAIFIFKIENIYAIEDRLAGEQRVLAAAVLPTSFENFLSDQNKKFG